MAVAIFFICLSPMRVTAWCKLDTFTARPIIALFATLIIRADNAGSCAITSDICIKLTSGLSAAWRTLIATSGNVGNTSVSLLILSTKIVSKAFSVDIKYPFA